MSLPENKAPYRSNWRILAILLCSVWILAIGFVIAGFDLFGLFCLLVGAISGIILAWLRRRVLIGMIVPITVVCLFGGFGIFSWFSARPVFLTMGLPGRNFSNLDPETRCYRETGGCVITGTERIVHLPYNSALQLMCTLWGPPPQTYHGPYPTAAEVVRLTRNSPAVPLKTFLDGKLSIEGRSLAFGRKKVENLLDDLGNRLAKDPEEYLMTEVKAVLVQQQCLAIRVTTQKGQDPGQEESDGIYLFNADGLRPIARFILRGDAPRYPRLL
ncbi:MAG: hypothetical protein EBS05_06735 [Proteobacteria bacterium]|nr:hypothetical protein [Pseudomonadota bacterium]